MALWFYKGGVYIVICCLERKVEINSRMVVDRRCSAYLFSNVLTISFLWLLMDIYFDICTHYIDLQVLTGRLLYYSYMCMKMLLFLNIQYLCDDRNLRMLSQCNWRSLSWGLEEYVHLFPFCLFIYLFIVDFYMKFRNLSCEMKDACEGIIQGDFWWNIK